MNDTRYTPGPWYWHDDTLTTSDGTPVSKTTDAVIAKAEGARQ